MFDSLRQEKLRYLQMKVIYQELKDILLDHEIEKVDHVTDNQSVQVLSRNLFFVNLKVSLIIQTLHIAPWDVKSVLSAYLKAQGVM